jgi:predicted nucleic-acid-binding Zn-ribbon protein
MKSSTCTDCGSSNLFRSNPVSSGGGYAPDYLPGLRSMWKAAKFEMVLCKDCGLTRFIASPEAREKVSDSKYWKRI